MNEIFSRETMRKRGYQARADGKGRDEHNMNPGAPAIEEWQQGWDYRLAEELREQQQESTTC